MDSNYQWQQCSFGHIGPRAREAVNYSMRKADIIIGSLSCVQVKVDKDGSSWVTQGKLLEAPLDRIEWQILLEMKTCLSLDHALIESDVLTGGEEFPTFCFYVVTKVFHFPKAIIGVFVGMINNFQVGKSSLYR